jgi:hypothetical protein
LTGALDLPSIQDVHEGNRKDVGLFGTSKVRDVRIERDALLSSTGLGNGQADTKDGVGTKLGLVGGSIQVNKELVNLGLVLDIEVLLDKSRGDGLVDVLHRLEDALAGPLGLVAVAELASLVLAYSYVVSSCMNLKAEFGSTNR